MNEGTNLDYHRLFAESAAWTLGAELMVLFLIVRFWFKVSSQKLSSPLLVFAGVFCSAGTLPWLWFVLPRVFQTYIAFMVIGELLVWGVEALFYRVVLELGWGRSALLSFACNLVSCGIGFLRQ